MNVPERINAFAELGGVLRNFVESPEQYPDLERVVEKTSEINPWFVPEFAFLAIKSIIPWLDKNKLTQWVDDYNLPSHVANVGVVMAGNIPLVGFHDFLSILILGHNIFVKLSSKDRFLLPSIAGELIKIAPSFKKKIHFSTEVFSQVDALVATGSDNSSRYFNYYFSNKPRIIRQNRNSVAILTGHETPSELDGLASDICTYFGLGCRNVSKLYIPNIAIIGRLKQSFAKFNWILSNQSYSSNFLFQKARLTTLQVPFVEVGPVLLVENNQLSSPIAMLHYSVYQSVEKVEEELLIQEINIQCVVGKARFDCLPLGRSQSPDLTVYADNVDTMAFLSQI